MAPAYMLSPFVAKNREILQARWPAIWEQVATAPLPPTHRPTNTPEPTLVVEGLHLASGYDRCAEAALQARLIPVDASEAWVYGVGLGDLPTELLKRRTLQRLHAVILNPAVFRAMLDHIDHTPWLADPRVVLHDGAALPEVQRPFAAVPPCLRLASPEAARLRDLIALELATPFLRKRHARRIDWAERSRQNQAFLRVDGDVQALFGTRTGAAFIVAGAGPTLGDGLALIETLRPSCLLIAVLAAYHPLVSAGLIPDIVVAIDPHEQGTPSATPSTHPPLVYFPAVPPAVLGQWTGPRLTAFPNRPDHPQQDVQDHFPRGQLYSVGDPLHAALDLAVRMGAARTVLVGADFAFPGGYSHAVGTPQRVAVANTPNDPWVLNGYGARVPTTAGLRGSLRDLERYVGDHPDVAIINASRDGALIAGTTYLDEVHA